MLLHARFAATKGTLVTTTGFGNDSYEFANVKPLTLINGGQLLYLLEKYGHKAYMMRRR